MKILLTGGSGTLGSIIQKHIKVDILPRNIDLTYYKDIDSSYDVIIHAAIKGAHNTKGTDYSIVYENLAMFHNVLKSFPNSKIINIGSGAELPSGLDIPEESLLEYIPILPYGLSKNLIARECLKNKNCYNLRMFGVISSTRLFKALEENDTLEISDDRYMDYISVEDFIKILNHYIHNDGPKDINMSYKKKKRVSRVALEYINNNALACKLRITGILADKYSYTGSSEKLDNLGIL